MGRPTSQDPRTQKVTLRFTEAEWTTLKLRAGDITVSEYVRMKLGFAEDVPTAVPPRAPLTFTDVCRRCGHPKGSHGRQGCLASCHCTEKRYQAAGAQ